MGCRAQVIPESIGRHRVHRVLGAGGFATVYLAEDPSLDAQVAIKVLAPNFAADPDIRARFINEARLMRRLNVPGLVTIYDVDEQQGTPYFVMEYCERGTLADRLTQLGRPTTLEETLGLISSITAATSAIHRAGMVHRDLKPSNYLIRHTPYSTSVATGDLLATDEELVVADFGLAKIVNLDGTRLSIAAGTPGYGAPEQFRGDPTIDATADVYAATAIVVHAMTATPPRPVVVDAEPFTPDDLAKTEPLRDQLEQGLSTDRATRPADIEQWQRRLRPEEGPDERDRDETGPSTHTRTAEPAATAAKPQEQDPPSVERLATNRTQTSPTLATNSQTPRSTGQPQEDLETASATEDPVDDDPTVRDRFSSETTTVEASEPVAGGEHPPGFVGFSRTRLLPSLVLAAQFGVAFGMIFRFGREVKFEALNDTIPPSTYNGPLQAWVIVLLALSFTTTVVGTKRRRSPALFAFATAMLMALTVVVLTRFWPLFDTKVSIYEPDEHHASFGFYTAAVSAITGSLLAARWWQRLHRGR